MGGPRGTTQKNKTPCNRPLGHGLTVYDFRGPWDRKSAYDTVYQRRFDAGQGLRNSGIIAASLSVPFLLTGPLLEATTLNRLHKTPMVLGIVGVSLFGAGMSHAGMFGLFFSTPQLFAGAALAGTGLFFCMAQLAVNIRVSKNLSEAERDRLYHPIKHSLRVAVAPNIDARTGRAGLSVVGTFW